MRTLIPALLAAVLVAGCGGATAGSSPLGYDAPPASLDPDSPNLAAKDIAFTVAELDVPAGVPFILVFENREGVSHNVSIATDAASTNRVFEGVAFTGPGTRWYPVAALAAGDYVFKCDLHPNMTGRLHAS